MIAAANCRLAVLASHPIQYFTPIYQRLAGQPGLDVEVFFCRDFGVTERYDEQFGRTIRWDTDLLSGYRHRFLTNISPIDNPHNPLHAINPGAFFHLLRGFDALWINGHMYPSNWLAVAAAWFRGTRILLRSELKLDPRRRTASSAIRDAVVRGWVRRSDALLYIGERNRAAYAAFGAAPKKLFFTPYSVDVDRIVKASSIARRNLSDCRARWGLPINRVVIAFVGKLTTRKHPEAVLELLANPEIASRSHIVFAGSGPCEILLRDEAKSRGFHNVTFLGFVNQSALPDVYAIADLFVMPSEFEPWGLVLNEAMASGLPAVVSDEVGAATDLVEGHDTGFVFPNRRWDIMTVQVARLVMDRRLRMQLGENARRRASLYNYDRATEGILEALRALGLYDRIGSSAEDILAVGAP